MDVKQLTMAIQLMADDALDLHKKLDNDLFNHISLVANRCLFILKEDGANKESLIQCGKFLLRLFSVIQAYNHKKRNATLSDLINIADEFRAVFGG